MKNRIAFRRGARWWAGIGLLVAAALYLLGAPQVDDADGALLGGGVTVSQGVVMRSLAVLDVIAGLWVLIRPRTYPALTAAAAGLIALWLSPRLKDPALVDIGGFALDIRFVVHPLEVVVIVAAVAVVVSAVSAGFQKRARTGQRR
ncbi:hypothetical protein ASF48_05500 [Rathayibacter sp. Leaf299]|uniref:hypothetical protein n=1 Tax=unclassified Rathayibacter TaxID=2609250 RepID=UPI0006FCC46A|nr:MULTISPECIES: hypothetical protein [unclassified Rathayibacter]KQQ22633.1 hypothetical protein ASF48_05500 [Rathayibacter sp. Leaf299]